MTVWARVNSPSVMAWSRSPVACGALPAQARAGVPSRHDAELEARQHRVPVDGRQVAADRSAQVARTVAQHVVGTAAPEAHEHVLGAAGQRLDVLEGSRRQALIVHP